MSIWLVGQKNVIGAERNVNDSIGQVSILGGGKNGGRGSWREGVGRVGRGVMVVDEGKDRKTQLERISSDGSILYSGRLERAEDWRWSEAGEEAEALAVGHGIFCDADHGQ